MINGDLSKNALLTEVQTLQWKAGSPAIFIAAGASQMKGVKHYVQSMPEFNRTKMYAFSYWKE